MQDFKREEKRTIELDPSILKAARDKEADSEEPSAGSGTRRVTITVPEALDTEIREVAESLNKGISEIWVDAAESFLARLKAHPAPPPAVQDSKRLIPVKRA